MKRDTVAILDASPLIFLAKVGQLPLVASLGLGSLYLPDAVERELLVPSPEAPPRAALQEFLRTCRVVPVEGARESGVALSLADRCVLELALRWHADLVVADDLALRRAAEGLGLHPLGTLGLLALAVKRRRLTRSAAAAIVRDLVERHRFRIGAAVYAEFERRVGCTGQ